MQLSFQYKFLDSEKLLEFKIKFVIYILYMNIVIFSAMSLLHYMEVIKITDLLVGLNFIYIIGSFIGMMFLFKDRKYYEILAYSVIFALLTIVTINLISVQADKFAFMWYIPVIIGTYVALNIKEGVIVTFLSVVLILFAYVNECFIANIQSLNTLFGSIISSSIVGFIISDRLNKYDKENNIILHKLNVLASIDYLTAIFNRRAFFEHSNKLLGFAKRNNLDVCVIMMDIDYFKKINDIYGHEEGDKVLQKVVQLVSSSIRTEDIFGRIGGEEFALLVLNCDKVKGFKIAEKIRKLIEEDKYIKVTISLGFHSNEKDKCYDIEELLNIADAALYDSKGSGRNKVSYRD